MALAEGINTLRTYDADAASLPSDAITLHDVDKFYQSRGGEVHALQHIDLSIRPNEFVCLLGPSGCGKSTILSLIAGLITPSKGSVRIGGQSIEFARKAHQVGLVFQDAVLLPWRTVAENVSLPLEVLRLPRSERQARIKAALALVRLEGFDDRFPHELSGGMQQRLGIARALSFNPSVLLMDEPFGALDAITRDQMSSELLRIWEEQRKTVVFVTHSIGEAAFLADRIIVMSPRPGRITAVFENSLPRPRTFDMRETSNFIAFSRKLRKTLEAT